MAGPTVSSFAPGSVSANAGNTTTVTGVGFSLTPVTATVNGSPAVVSVTNDTTLVLTLPATGPASIGAAVVVVTNSGGSTTNNSGLTVTSYVVPTRNNISQQVSSFDTSGTTTFPTNIFGQYQQGDAITFGGSYSVYLAKTAKIKAVALFNNRYPAQAIAPATY